MDDVQGMDRHIRLKGRIYILIDRDTGESVAVEYGTGGDSGPRYKISAPRTDRIVTVSLPGGRSQMVTTKTFRKDEGNQIGFSSGQGLNAMVEVETGRMVLAPPILTYNQYFVGTLPNDGWLQDFRLKGKITATLQSALTTVSNDAQEDLPAALRRVVDVLESAGFTSTSTE